MASLEQLIRRRATTKAYFTRCEKFLENPSRNINEINVRENLLKENYKKYLQIQEEIEEIDTSQEADREEIESRFISLAAKFELLTLQNRQRSNVPRESVSNESQANTSSTTSTRLPKLDIPKFKGDYQSWNSFKDLYVAAIHNNCQLSNVHKFQYLKTLLLGEPLALTESLETTSDNYVIAWELLEKRFSNPSKIANEHIKALLDLKPVTKNNAAFLRALISQSQQHINALKALELPIDTWDVILVFIIGNKLDFQTRRAYEQNKNSKAFPKLSNFLEYIEDYCSSLENAVDSSTRDTTQKRVNYFTQSEETTQRKCYFCAAGDHSIYTCEGFKKASQDEKYKCIKDRNLCINCFRKHNYKSCSSSLCRNCGKKHNTLLCDTPNEQTALHTYACQNSEVLLPTAQILVRNAGKFWVPARALLDSASQNSFVTESLAQRLRLPNYNQNILVSGLANTKTKTSKMVNLLIKSKISNFQTTTNCLVIPHITDQLPRARIETRHYTVPFSIKNNLADPQFNQPNQIDILLGADTFFQVLSTGKLSLGPGLPHFQNSHFGYIVSGEATSTPTRTLHSVSLHTMETDITTIMSKFWKIEELPMQKLLTPEESLCENSFKSSVIRLENGQFQVKLPFIQEPNESLGSSLDQARKRFFALERRLVANTQVYDSYKHFIEEYISLGHAKYLSEGMASWANKENPGFFCPHHAVINEAKESTKLRVVFDGSCKTTSGLSLNEILGTGPMVQPNLLDIILRFRSHKYVFTADIKKMYRMILVDPEQRKYQRILWRNSPRDNLQCLELATVTYGFASSPFLATRTLNELAINYGKNHPVAQQAILQDCYVDDFLCGKNTIDELQVLQAQLIELLGSAGMQLHKWHSNCKLEHPQTVPINQFDKLLISTLGLSWDHEADQFLIKTEHLPGKTPNDTKRSTLSSIGKLFDPLGLISPVVITAKIIMQEIWILKLNWDEKLPDALLSRWREFLSELSAVKQIKIPRWCLSDRSSPREMELCGFSDASAQAYGACIYLRAKYADDSHSARLLCAKSRVSPLKTLTIPRLELCGALLLSRLACKVRETLKIPISRVILFTDSSIVLSWLHIMPTRLNVFVAHRIAEIQETTSTFSWSHIDSKLNPADLISRGLSPKALTQCTLWWEGPPFLIQKSELWPKSKFQCVQNEKLPEVRKTIASVSLVTTQIDDSLINALLRCSNLHKLKRTFGYVLRFIKNIKGEKLSGSLSAQELANALTVVISLTQQQAFSQETNLLKNGEFHNHSSFNSSKLKNLNPILDKQGCLRVGGRLQWATNLTTNQKHPFILPAKHHVTTLIIKAEHERLLHAGTSTVLGNLRQNFWPLNARNQIKQIIRECITCHRFKQQTATQLMGNLPANRITPAKPFITCGVDYAGPIMVKNSLLRRSQLTKAYVAVFICFTTKAIHIELVSDLTTQAFLGAVKRFTARRGAPSKIYSDNGTQFKAASTQLTELYALFKNKTFCSTVIDTHANSGISWSFIPPASPSMGGLWERSIQSIKHHLLRVTKNTNFHFEQLYTCLVQIEAIINSRPLLALSNDINEYNYLSPSHFLINSSAQAIPEKDLSNVPENRLKLWQQVTRIQQSFWKQWSKQYLHSLQERSKWIKPNPNIQVGTLVLLKEDNLPPQMWALGRIVQTFPGADERVRVVSVKTKTGTYKRSLNKLAPLPFDSAQSIHI